MKKFISLLTLTTTLSISYGIELQKKQAPYYHKGANVPNLFQLIANQEENDISGVKGYGHYNVSSAIKLKHLPTEWRHKATKEHEKLTADKRLIIDVDQYYRNDLISKREFRDADLDLAFDAYKEKVEVMGFAKRVKSDPTTNFSKALASHFHERLIESRKLFAELSMAIVQCAQKGDEEHVVSIPGIHPNNTHKTAMYHVNKIECEDKVAKKLQKSLQKVVIHDQSAPYSLKVGRHFELATRGPALPIPQRKILKLSNTFNPTNLAVQGEDGFMGCIDTNPILYDNYGIKHTCCTEEDECEIYVEFAAKMPTNK